MCVCVCVCVCVRVCVCEGVSVSDLPLSPQNWILRRPGSITRDHPSSITAVHLLKSVTLPLNQAHDSQWAYSFVFNIPAEWREIQTVSTQVRTAVGKLARDCSRNGEKQDQREKTIRKHLHCALDRRLHDHACDISILHSSHSPTHVTKSLRLTVN